MKTIRALSAKNFTAAGLGIWLLWPGCSRGKGKGVTHLVHCVIDTLSHRNQQLLATVISAGELATTFPSTPDARRFLRNYRILRLTPEIAYVAALVDRELIQNGQRLGENDNWIAGFCRYYRQPVVSCHVAFDRVRGLRRLVY
jgi:predicted nucleic acid-binding protein